MALESIVALHPLGFTVYNTTPMHLTHLASSVQVVLPEVRFSFVLSKYMPPPPSPPIDNFSCLFLFQQIFECIPLVRKNMQDEVVTLSTQEIEAQESTRELVLFLRDSCNNDFSVFVNPNVISLPNVRYLILSNEDHVFRVLLCLFGRRVFISSF